MPQYEPLPKLKGQPFTLLIAEPLGEPEATLGQFVVDFPVEPGIAQIIYPHTIESPSLPGLTVVAREPGEPLGPWLSQALVKADSPRVLMVAGLLPTAETVKAMAEKLDLAHLVLAPRPQKSSAGLHWLWGRRLSRAGRVWVAGAGALPPTGFSGFPAMTQKHRCACCGAKWFRR